MPTLTDDAIERLLRETFAAHESLADPDRARRLAEAPQMPQRKRRWTPALVAASAVAAAAVGATIWGGGHPTGSSLGRPTSTGPTSTIMSEREKAQAALEEKRARELAAQAASRANTAAAQTEVLRLVSLAPRVPGAREVPARKGGDDLFTYYAGQVSADQWYAVDASAAATMRYLRAHPPAGLTLQAENLIENDFPAGRLVSLRYAAAPTSAFTTPLLDLSVIRPPSGPTLYRVQAATSWRESNPVSEYLNGVTVMSYEIIRPVKNDPGTSRTVVRGNLTDPVAITTVTSALGNLAAQPRYFGHCPYRGESQDRFTFTGPGQPAVTVVARLGCPEVVSVTPGPGAQEFDLADPHTLDRVWTTIVTR